MVLRTLARADRDAWRILPSMARQYLQGLGKVAYSGFFTLAKRALGSAKKHIQIIDLEEK